MVADQQGKANSIGSRVKKNRHTAIFFFYSPRKKTCPPDLGIVPRSSGTPSKPVAAIHGRYPSHSLGGFSGSSLLRCTILKKDRPEGDPFLVCPRKKTCPPDLGIVPRSSGTPSKPVAAIHGRYPSHSLGGFSGSSLLRCTILKKDRPEGDPFLVCPRKKT